MEKYLIFTILGQYYTFPSKLISEVATCEKVYSLPLMPEYVMGIINRYSVPFALLDLGILIQKTATPHSKLVVLKEKVDKLAFLIDDVVDIVDIPQEALMKIEQGAENTDITEIIDFSFEWQGTNVFVLSMEQIMARIRSDFDI